MTPLRMAKAGLKPVVRRSSAVGHSASFPALCRAVGLPSPVPEYRFHEKRKWRIDWCWPEQKVGLEVDGAVWVAGRHTRGSGWMKDTEKLNAAAIAGFRMLRATPQQVATGAILDTVQAMFREIGATR